MVSTVRNEGNGVQGPASRADGVIFEEINALTVSLAIRFCRDGIPVYYFGIEKQFLQNGTIAEGMRNRTVIDLSKETWDFLDYMEASVAAHKNLEAVWEQESGTSPSVRVTRDLYHSEELENMYKKDLLISLQKIYYLQRKINSFTRLRNIKVIFYPNDNFSIHTGEWSLLEGRVNVEKPVTIRWHIRNLIRKAEDIVFLAVPFYLALKKIRWITFGSQQKEHYSLGINANLPGLLSFNYHYVDYLVDPQHGFPREEIVFIDEASQGRLSEEFSDNGFSSFGFFSDRRTVSSHFFFSHLLTKLLPAYLRCCISALSESRHVITTNRKILTDYCRWHLLFDLFSIDRHVTVLLPENISKNLIFSEYNCRTYFVHPDNYVAHYHTGRSEDVRTGTVHVFMNSDYAVIFGDIVRRYFAYHPNKVKEYLTLGVLASQRVDAIRTGVIPSRIQPLLNEKKLSGKIIGVFDTSYADFGVIKVKEGIRFAEEIYRLLEECPDISIIFKEKKPLSVTPELALVYSRLEQHPRCLVIRKTENACIFSTDVIACCDLVISVAYTSTNAEALGARVRAVYYDINGNEKGPGFYFDRYPDFVAHDFQDLKRLVRFWLYEASDETFGKFLDTYVKGEIDPFLDMKAVNRLQMLLRE